MNQPQTPDLPPKEQFLVYRAEDGKMQIDVRLEGETVWLSQAQIAELFQTSPQNITLHLKSIFDEGELTEAATCKDYLQVRLEGKREVQRNIRHCNLDAIISVGYRVKSAVATRFRIWATQKLREFIVKGFVLDDERLKNPNQPFDYFDELLRRIQDINRLPEPRKTAEAVENSARMYHTRLKPGVNERPNVFLPSIYELLIIIRRLPEKFKSFEGFCLPPCKTEFNSSVQ
jgi:hypothetical protein